MKKTKLGEELPKISRACVNNANSLPSLYNNTCSEREIINKHRKMKSACFQALQWLQNINRSCTVPLLS